MPAHLAPETYKFLRGLKRNNDREWFNARKDVYERALKEPFLALIDEVNTALDIIAPEHVRPANKIAMRIYRDTRFSLNKIPYKTHLAAWWSARGMEKTSGGGFYLQVAPTGVLFAAGVYMPEREQLLRIREWMSGNHKAYRAQLKKLYASKTLPFVPIDAQPLTRMPKGFAADDPADELLRAKNWGVHAHLPAEAALGPTFAAQIARHMKATAPLVATLNAAISGDSDERRPTPLRALGGMF